MLSKLLSTFKGFREAAADSNIKGLDTLESQTEGNAVMNLGEPDGLSAHDFIIDWLSINGYRPYIHETGTYRANLGSYMLNFELTDVRCSFFILAAIMSIQEYEDSDKLEIYEIVNQLNNDLMMTSVKVQSIGPFFTLCLSNTYISNESMVFLLDEQLDQLHTAAESLKDMWLRRN